MSVALSIPNDEAAILARAVDSANWTLTRDAAQALVELKLADDDQQRMDELAQKARAGELTADDEVEIDNYRQIGCLIEVMKSKARLSLRNASV